MSADDGSPGANEQQAGRVQPSRRVKRRLLKQAVRDNVRVLRNDHPPGLSRHAGLRRWLRGLGLVLGGTLLVAASHQLAAALDGLSAVKVDSAPPARQRGVPARGVAAVASEGWVESANLDPRVLPLDLRTVVLDPGHGGRDHGAVTPDGLYEKDLTLDIVRRLRDVLRQHGVEVVLTRQTDRAVELRERAAIANRAGGDLFLSVHVNWFEGIEGRGVETFFLGPTDDPFLVERASFENRGSGYSFADVRSLLDGIFLDVRQGKSRQLAGSIQKTLFNALRAESPDLRDRGVKSAPFLVLVDSEMPAALAEVACLSNEREAELLSQPQYRQVIAEALYAGIAGYRSAPPEESERRESPPETAALSTMETSVNALRGGQP